MNDIMRWIGLAVAALALSPMASSAQDKEGYPGVLIDSAAHDPASFASDTGKEPVGLPERLLRLMRKELRLSDEQGEKAGAILGESRPKMEELHKKMRELGEQKRKLLRADLEKIRGLLDDDQRERFDELKSRMLRGPSRDFAVGRPMPGGAGPGRREPPSWKRRPHGPHEGSQREEEPCMRWIDKSGREHLSEGCKEVQSIVIEEPDARDLPPPEMWHKGKQ